MAVKTVKGNLQLTNVNATVMQNLLIQRHKKDVLVEQCKNGETWGARDLLKLDAWALLRTYTPLTTIGYEIKTSRADFESDQKWTGYLDLCHLFYFICPSGLIRATDLPNGIGIIWATPNRLHTKRKAERHKPDMEKVNRLMTYILMSRSKIVGDMYEANRFPTEPISHCQSLRNTVAQAEERKELAWFVKGHVREFHLKTKKASNDLVYREDAIKRFEEQLAQLGITWDSEHNNWQDNREVESAIAMLKEQIDHYTLEKLRIASGSMLKAVESIQQFYKEARKEGT